jgi:two-component system phosphate regulon sensor histidine kinase PhoR
MILQSLRSKLTVYGLLSLLLVFTVLGVFLALDFRHYLLRLAAEDMREQALLLGQQYNSVLFGGAGPDSIRSFTLSQSRLLGKRLTLIDKAGIVRYDSEISADSLLRMDNHLARPEVMKASAVGWGYTTRYSRTLRREMIYLAVPIRSGDEWWGYCRLAWPWESFLNYQRRLVLSLVTALAAASLLLLILTGMVWGSATRAIRQIELVSQRIASGDLQARAPVNQGPRETILIARSINAMAESWELTAGTLREQTAQLESILESMSEGILVCSGDGRVRLINRAAAAMLGVDEIQSKGKLVLELVRLPVMERLVNGSTYIAEVGIGGRVCYIHASDLKSGEGGRVLVLMDISELKKLENIRRDFVANVSHELKTPLSAIVGFTEALQDGAKQEQTQRDDFLERIQRQALRMTKIVEDLLDLSGMETGVVRLNLQSLKTRQIIERTLESMELQVGERSRIGIREDDTLEADVSADEDRVVQAMTNLIGNALKFAPEGSPVMVGVEVGGGFVKIFVSDNGPGIEEKHLPRLFERFYRVDKSRSKELGGTGLGLAIVKHIAELHGGSAGVESQLGKGSTFWIKIPTKA